MALRSLRPSAKAVTVLGIIAALLFFGCIGTYLLTAGQLRDARAQLKQKEQEVSDSERVTRMESRAEADYRTAVAQLSNLEKSVSTRKYIPTLLAQLEDLARETNLRVVSIRPEEPPPPPPAAQGSESPAQGEKKEGGATEPAGTPAKKNEPPKPYDPQPIYIEVSGRYWNVVSFLYQLTTFPKIIAVNSLDAEPATTAEPSGSPKLLVKLKVTAFIFRDAESTEPKTKPGQTLPNMAQPEAARAGKPAEEAKV